MTRQSSQPDSSSARPQPRQASSTVPDKPRDCGPNVDTWPILDEPQAATSKSKDSRTRK